MKYTPREDGAPREIPAVPAGLVGTFLGETLEHGLPQAAIDVEDHQLRLPFPGQGEPDPPGRTGEEWIRSEEGQTGTEGETRCVDDHVRVVEPPCGFVVEIVGERDITAVVGELPVDADKPILALALARCMAKRVGSAGKAPHQKE